MVKKILQCDICGDKWDITNTDYCDYVYPGYSYIKECIREGKRTYIIKIGTACEDGRVEEDEIDICDKCYRSIDRFIERLKIDEEVGPNYNA